MMILSATSGCGAFSPNNSISSSLARSPRSSRVLMLFWPNRTSMLGETPSRAAKSSETPSVRRSSSNWRSCSSRNPRPLARSSSATSSSKPSISASSSIGTKATCSSVVNPSATRRWAMTSSTSSASINSCERVRISSWRRRDSSSSVKISISQPESCEAKRTFCPRRPMASDS